MFWTKIVKKKNELECQWKRKSYQANKMLTKFGQRYQNLVRQALTTIGSKPNSLMNNMKRECPSTKFLNYYTNKGKKKQNKSFPFSPALPLLLPLYIIYPRSSSALQWLPHSSLLGGPQVLLLAALAERPT